MAGGNEALIDVDLHKETQRLGAVPLVWASVAPNATLNFGDALSPVMTALVSGRPITYRAHDATAIRMTAVGTIGHALRGGTAVIWGTGTARHTASPSGIAEVADQPSRGTALRVHATRGPVSRALFGEENAVGPAVFGDPVWLLPDFYRPAVEKRYDLGVVVHLADLSTRSLDVRIKPGFLRYHVPEMLKGSVRLINTVTPVGVEGVKNKIDEILACRRIVSTSLHGLVIPESYGIPCLYFAPRGRGEGLLRRVLDPDDGNDLRMTDLYLGLGRRDMPVYLQPRRKPTDWERLIRAIDAAWEPTSFDTGGLRETMPLPFAPLMTRPGSTVFDHPIIQAIPLRPRSPRAVATRWLRSLVGRPVGRDPS